MYLSLFPVLFLLMIVRVVVRGMAGFYMQIAQVVVLFVAMVQYPSAIAQGMQ